MIAFTPRCREVSGNLKLTQDTSQLAFETTFIIKVSKLRTRELVFSSNAAMADVVFSSIAAMGDVIFSFNAVIFLSKAAMASRINV